MATATAVVWHRVSPPGIHLLYLYWPTAAMHLSGTSCQAVLPCGLPGSPIIPKTPIPPGLRSVCWSRGSGFTRGWKLPGEAVTQDGPQCHICPTVPTLKWDQHWEMQLWVCEL